MYLLTILLCKSAGFQKCDFSVAIQIFLVTDEDYDNVWTGKGSGICQPVCQRVVCFTAAITSKKKTPYAKVIVSANNCLEKNNISLFLMKNNCSHNFQPNGFTRVGGIFKTWQIKR